MGVGEPPRARVVEVRQGAGGGFSAALNTDLSPDSIADYEQVPIDGKVEIPEKVHSQKYVGAVRPQIENGHVHCLIATGRRENRNLTLLHYAFTDGQLDIYPAYIDLRRAGDPLHLSPGVGFEIESIDDPRRNAGRRSSRIDKGVERNEVAMMR